MIGRATDQAAAAAKRSGVVVRALSEPPDLHELIGLFDRIWGTAGSPPLSFESLRALTHVGNYASAAYAGDRMLGACIGFFAAPAQRTLHSDVMGVSADARDRHVGFALKLHQRAWALDRGIETVTWTFDPLGSRNAYLNTAKLRARGVSYHEDFYGEMSDAINQGQGSDRLLASWQLTSPDVVRACEGPTSVPSADDRLPVMLEQTAQGPVEHLVDQAAPRVRVAIPDDIEALRRLDPERARDWRTAVRRIMGRELAAGGQVVAFGRGAGYVLERGAARADHHH